MTYLREKEAVRARWYVECFQGDRTQGAVQDNPDRDHTGLKVCRHPEHQAIIRERNRSCRLLSEGAFTLAEVMVSVGLVALALSAMITGYTSTAERAEWSAYSMAANELALQRLEQARATKWDVRFQTPVDELVEANFPPLQSILDIPVIGDTNNASMATVFTTIREVSSDPPLKFIQVDSVWTFKPGQTFTNTVSVYRAPDA